MTLAQRIATFNGVPRDSTNYPLILPQHHMDFVSSKYAVNQLRYPLLSDVPGYTFSRSGQQGAVDSDGTVKFYAAGVPAINGKGFHVYGALTNLLLNAGSATNLITQTVTVTAVAHTLAFIGTGTVTLSGASMAGPLVGTGATDQVRLNFTPTAGVLTLTVTGTVQFAGLMAATLGLPVPVITTTGATASIGASSHEIGASLPNGDFIAWMAFNLSALPAAGGITPFAYSTAGSGSTNERLWLHIASTGTMSTVITAGGVAQPLAGAIGTVVVAGGGRVVVMFRRKNGKYSIAAKKSDGTIAIGADASGVGLVPAITTVDIGVNHQGSGEHLNGRVEGLFQRNGTFSDAEITTILGDA